MIRFTRSEKQLRTETHETEGKDSGEEKEIFQSMATIVCISLHKDWIYLLFNTYLLLFPILQTSSVMMWKHYSVLAMVFQIRWNCILFDRFDFPLVFSFSSFLFHSFIPFTFPLFTYATRSLHFIQKGYLKPHVLSKLSKTRSNTASSLDNQIRTTFCPFFFSFNISI